MAHHQGELFRNATVRVDGETYEGCTFDHCQVVFAGTGAFQASHCTFNACVFSFDGPALQTLRFMAAMYRLSSTVVEGMFDASLLAAGSIHDESGSRLWEVAARAFGQGRAGRSRATR